MLNWPNSIDKSSHLPLYFQIEEIIKNQIEKGILKPDEMIPTENELGAYFEVSRITVRQAIADLVNENLLYKKKGVGTFVAKPKINLQYIKSFDSFNAQMEEVGMTPSTKVIKFGVVPVSSDIKKMLRIDGSAQVIELIRVRYVNDEPSAYVRSYLPHHLCEFILSEDLEKKSLFGTLAQNQNTKVVQVERIVEAVLANREDRKYLNIEKGFPIQSFINTAYNEKGDVIEYCIAHYRGDINQFRVQIKV